MGRGILSELFNPRHEVGGHSQSKETGITPRRSATPTNNNHTAAMNTNDIIQITLVGAVFIDFSRESVGERIGAKRPVRYKVKLGGSAGNMLRGLAPLGLRINVHSAAHPLFAQGIRDEVRRLGGTPFIVENEDAMAISTIEQAPNGGSLLDVHRPKLRHKDIAATDFASNVRSSALTILGPISDRTEAVALMQEIADSAQCAVMIPHPNVLADPGFAVAVGKLAAIVLNRDEATRLTPGSDAPQVPELYLHHLTGGETDIVVTDGRGPLRAWAQKIWHHKLPRAVERVRSDFGAGDTLSARYFYYRFLAGLPAGVALDRALDDVAEFLRGPAESTEAEVPF